MVLAMLASRVLYYPQHSLGRAILLELNCQAYAGLLSQLFVAGLEEILSLTVNSTWESGVLPGLQTPGSEQGFLC